MNTNYEALLIEYAAGTLDMAQNLIVSAHLSLAPQARKIVSTCESIGGVLIETHCEPVAMHKTSLEDVLQRLDEKPEAQRPAVRTNEHLPEDLCDLPSCIEENINCKPRTRLKWKKVYPGINSFALPLECRRSKAHMYRIAPGIRTPKHEHRGLEITLVLDGAFEDETGAYKKGDLLVSDAEDGAHSPTSCVNYGCICLSVTSAPLKFTGPLGLLLNPFTRF